jgi:hypothetical protein
MGLLTRPNGTGSSDDPTGSCGSHTHTSDPQSRPAAQEVNLKKQIPNYK